QDVGPQPLLNRRCQASRPVAGQALAKTQPYVHGRQTGRRPFCRQSKIDFFAPDWSTSAIMYTEIMDFGEDFTKLAGQSEIMYTDRIQIREDSVQKPFPMNAWYAAGWDAE